MMNLDKAKQKWETAKAKSDELDKRVDLATGKYTHVALAAVGVLGFVVGYILGSL